MLLAGDVGHSKPPGGPVLGAVFPRAPALPGVEVKAVLMALPQLPGAAELAEKLPKSGDKP